MIRKVICEVEGVIVREEELIMQQSSSLLIMHLKPWVRRNYPGKEYKVYESNIKKRFRVEIDMNEVLDLKKQGYDLTNIAKQIKVNPSTLSSRYHQFLRERGIE